jgi:hypothetical protein
LSAIPVTSSTITWQKKSDALDECVGILRNGGYALKAPITTARHVDVLNAILEIHPHSSIKRGTGVQYFYVDHVAHVPGVQVASDDIGFWIQRSDGTSVEISYTEAISPSDQRKKVTSALRAAVNAERLAFRDDKFAAGTTVSSDVSGVPFARRDDAIVIYQTPSFSQLAYRFAESEGGWDAISVSQGGGAAFIGDALVDPLVTARWVAFWRTHAVLVLATKSEGARRPRPDETAWTP